MPPRTSTNTDLMVIKQYKVDVFLWLIEFFFEQAIQFISDRLQQPNWEKVYILPLILEWRLVWSLLRQILEATVTCILLVFWSATAPKDHRD